MTDLNDWQKLIGYNNGYNIIPVNDYQAANLLGVFFRIRKQLKLADGSFLNFNNGDWLYEMIDVLFLAINTNYNKGDFITNNFGDKIPLETNAFRKWIFEN